MCKGVTQSEIDNLIKHTQGDLSKLLENGISKKKLGPAVATVYDTSTSKYYTAINDIDGNVAENIHPILKTIIDDMPENVKDSYMMIKGVDSHAEVNAINQALLDGAKPEDLIGYVVQTSNKNSGQAFNMCPHCKYILQDFIIISD